MTHEALRYLISTYFADLIIYHSPLPYYALATLSSFLPCKIHWVYSCPRAFAYAVLPCPYPRSLYGWFLILQLSAQISHPQWDSPCHLMSRNHHLCSNILSVWFSSSHSSLCEIILCIICSLTYCLWSCPPPLTVLYHQSDYGLPC